MKSEEFYMYLLRSEPDRKWVVVIGVRTSSWEESVVFDDAVDAWEMVISIRLFLAGEI